MGYALLDDRFHAHPKLVAAGWAARGLYAACLSYCANYLTDGFIPGSWVRSVRGDKLMQRLIQAQLCAQVSARSRYEIVASDGQVEELICAEDGYLIPDYLEYNPSRRQIAERRAQKAIAGRAGAKKRWQLDTVDNGTSHSEPIAEPIAPAMADAIAPAIGGAILPARASPAPREEEQEQSVPSVRGGGVEEGNLSALLAAAAPISVDDAIHARPGRTADIRRTT
jgi:hypothetical protein